MWPRSPRSSAGLGEIMSHHMRQYYDVVPIMAKEDRKTVRTASGARGEWFVHVRPCPQCGWMLLTDHHGRVWCNGCQYSENNG